MKRLDCMVLVFLTILLTACGGGGSGSSAQSNFVGGVTSMKVSGFIASINQNSSARTYIGQVNILSQGSPEITHMELYGINAHYFDIEVDGKVYLSSSAILNASIKASYNLEAIAYNGTYESNRVSVQITVINTDIPQIENLAVSVNENNASGSYVGDITITRVGSSPITAITLSGADSSHFSVDTAGEITIASGITLDYDTRALYSFEAIATNGDGDSHQKDVIITVNEVTVAASSVVTTPLLLILVSSSTDPIKDSVTNWRDKTFGNAYGQINHYFLEISNGTFGLSPIAETDGTVDDGVVEVSTGVAHPNIADPTNKYFGGDANIEAVIRQAESNGNIDFAQYDTSGNGIIEKKELHIMLLVGGGELASRVTPGVWAHAGGINITIDGVQIQGYSMFGEEQGSNSNRNFATIGVIAHELGHGLLDVPDLYSRPGGTGSGIGFWGLMASGSWAAKAGELSGSTPPHMCAWSKIEAGFQTPVIAASGSTTNIEMIATHLQTSNIIKVPIPGSTQEYFLVENKSPVGYDAGLYSLENKDFEGGVAIWHIDDAKNNYYEQNDDASHKLVDIEEADDGGTSMDAGNSDGRRENLFYAGNKTSFNDTTPIVNSKNYAGASTNVSISNVSAVGTAGSDYVMYIDVSR
ncbi:M6 family metalloprotease domain-containing protein [Sulfurimonas sp.]|nr:M6 family metalloprotease domain-containing protein [Sulfurimonas sp.]